MKIEVTNIKWESYNIEDIENLETTVVVDFPIELLQNENTKDIQDVIEDFASDEISNIVGFTHNGFGTTKILSV